MQELDPEEHIERCQRKILGYRDEIMWPHLFHRTLEDLPNKWYKMEEAQRETFSWKTLKENFIKYLSFSPAKECLKEFVQ